MPQLKYFVRVLRSSLLYILSHQSNSALRVRRKKSRGRGKGEKREREKRGMQARWRKQCPSTCVVIGQEKQVHYIP